MINQKQAKYQNLFLEKAIMLKHDDIQIIMDWNFSF